MTISDSDKRGSTDPQEGEGGPFADQNLSLSNRLVAAEAARDALRQELDDVQSTLRDLWALFTSTPKEIAAQFGESRVKCDSDRINYALELMEGVMPSDDRQAESDRGSPAGPRQHSAPAVAGEQHPADNTAEARLRAACQQLQEFAQHKGDCKRGSVVQPVFCPECSEPMNRVRNDSSYLNNFQFDAVKAGDWFCKRHNDSVVYVWDSACPKHDCTCGLTAVLEKWARGTPPPAPRGRKGKKKRK